MIAFSLSTNWILHYIYAFKKHFFYHLHILPRDNKPILIYHIEINYLNIFSESRSFIYVTARDSLLSFLFTLSIPS